MVSKESFSMPGDLKKMIGDTRAVVTSASGFSAANLGGGGGGGGGGYGGSSDYSGYGDSNDIIDLLTCSVGSSCYKTKRNQYLRQVFDDNRKYHDGSGLELSRAEKNYVVYNGGEDGGEDIYNKLIIDRFANTAQQFKKNSIDRQQQFMSDLLQSIKQYQAASVFKNQMANLLKMRQNENNDLKKNVNYYQKVIQTSERKVVYENKNMDGLYKYRRIMVFLYYGALISFIVFGNFIPDRLYSKASVWVIIVIVAIIPIIMNMLIMWIFIIYDTISYWFSELPHKDVYTDMGNPADEKPPGGYGPKPPIGG